jgi:hypothetical protein
MPVPLCCRACILRRLAPASLQHVDQSQERQRGQIEQLARRLGTGNGQRLDRLVEIEPGRLGGRIVDGIVDDELVVLNEDLQTEGLEPLRAGRFVPDRDHHRQRDGIADIVKGVHRRAQLGSRRSIADHPSRSPPDRPC